VIRRLIARYSARSWVRTVRRRAQQRAASAAGATTLVSGFLGAIAAATSPAAFGEGVEAAVEEGT